LDLVKHIRKEYQDFFCISVAGYPEGHPTVIKDVEEGRVLTESESKRVVYSTKEDGTQQLQVCFDEDYAKELAYLKEKVDAGADLIITQMFFDVDVMIQFIADCRAIGINIPIIPGIMMIGNYGGFKRMLGFCKTRVPKDVNDRVESLKDDKEGLKQYGIEFAKEVSLKLLENNIEVYVCFILCYRFAISLSYH
jgi:methylenetetrahydrofolate reductase (NADPH)